MATERQETIQERDARLRDRLERVEADYSHLGGVRLATAIEEARQIRKQLSEIPPPSTPGTGTTAQDSREKARKPGR